MKDLIIPVFKSTEHVKVPANLMHLPVIANNNAPYVSRYAHVQKQFNFNYWYRTSSGELQPCLKTKKGTRIYEGMGAFELLTNDAPVKQFYGLDEITIVKQTIFNTCLALISVDNKVIDVLHGISAVPGSPEHPYVSLYQYALQPDENEFAYHKRPLNKMGSAMKGGAQC